jgi:acetylornithine deacetylase/succinyl-diaminopimelate desuccinylase-like protein
MRFLLDRRLAPGEDVEDAIAQIRERVSELSPWGVTFERGALQYPTKHARDSKIVQTVADAYQVMLGKEPQFGYDDYTIDASFTNMQGIPTIMWEGVGTRFAHGDSDICQLDVCYDIAFAFSAIQNAQKPKGRSGKAPCGQFRAFRAP